MYYVTVRHILSVSSTMPPQVYYDIKKSNEVDLTIPNGSNESDWALLPSAVVKMVGLKVPVGIPNNRTLTFRIRTIEDPSSEYNIVDGQNGTQHLTVTTHDEDAFGGDSIIEIATFLDGFHELKLTVSGAAMVTDVPIKLSVPSSRTE